MASKRVRTHGQRIASSPEESASIGKNHHPPESLDPSPEELLRMPHAYLIRIPRRQDRERAIVAFMHVPRTLCRFRGYRFLVTREQLVALQKAGIPFEDLTDAN
jgi:hypothetical protein